MSVKAEKVLEIARGEIGTKATDIKKCKYNTWFYGGVVSGSEFDWCAAFICWIFNALGALDLIHGKNAGCGYMANAFKMNGELIYNKDYSPLSASKLKAGDIVFFHWSNEYSECCPGVYTCDHVGIVEKINADNTITTIEGNTGGTKNGEVMRRVRSMDVVSCAGRPKYAASDTDPVPSKSESPKVLYRVRAGGKWYKEVNGLSSYAGEIGVPITDVAIKVTQGKVRYRVHIKGGGWLPYVTGYDLNDHENGYAGDKKTIDAIEVYYFTPADLVAQKGYYKAKYRVSPVNGSYYPYQYDNDKGKGMDGYAGEFGKAIDRLQITLAK